jgi:long-chain acyl-CoA synthetase
MSPLLKEREVAHYLGDSGAGLVLAWHAFADEAHGGAGQALRDGWFHTGDLARVDSDGYFYIVDRKKDLIIRGGFNVYPREIEELLYRHLAVAEAAVIGVPHPPPGQEVGAAVTLEPGAVITAEALRQYVKALVAAYKYPCHLWVAEELPRGPTGKIVKREIVIPEDPGMR